MRCKTMLLGGAVALALSGAAYAQAQQPAPQTAPAGTDQINAGSAAGTQTQPMAPAAAPAKTGATTKRVRVHHVHHVVRHHKVHLTHTASLTRHHHHLRARMAARHGESTPAEREATRNLNQQQLQGGTMMNTGNMNGAPNGYAAPQAGPQPGAENPMPTTTNYGTPPGTENNPPSNATYTQPQGSPGVQPGTAGYQQPANGNPPGYYATSPGSEVSPTTPTEQAPPPPPPPSNPPSS